MGLEREYEEARAWVAYNLTLDQVQPGLLLPGAYTCLCRFPLVTALECTSAIMQLQCHQACIRASWCSVFLKLSLRVNIGSPEITWLCKSSEEHFRLIP